MRGKPVLSPPEVVDRRLETCEACSEHYRDGFAALRCRECSCFLMAKTMLATERCPLKKW